LPARLDGGHPIEPMPRSISPRSGPSSTAEELISA
jgi:hypothetical protein